MMPVSQSTAVDFLEWLRRQGAAMLMRHTSVRDMSEEEFISLGQRYDASKGFRGDGSLRRASWQTTHYVFRGHQDEQDAVKELPLMEPNY